MKNSKERRTFTGFERFVWGFAVIEANDVQRKPKGLDYL